MEIDGVYEIRLNFQQLLHKTRVGKNRNDNKLIEIIGASFLANEDYIFGEPNNEYINAEIAWYKSQSTNIYDIPYKPTPSAWKHTANKNGEINSNYGRLIFSPLFFEQYNNVKEELKRNYETRRATMIYTRPSMWEEYRDNSKNDFICTNAVTYYNNGHYLDCVVQMRSNDAVYGYKNDYAWQKFVLNKLCDELCMEPGKIIWQVQNLHVYEKHFDLVKNW